MPSRLMIPVMQLWVASLPSRLQFNESTLRFHASNAEFSSGIASWAYALMHCLSSCVILALHAVCPLIIHVYFLS